MTCRATSGASPCVSAYARPPPRSAADFLARRHEGIKTGLNYDGHKIRLYSTKSMKPLGTLRYHENGCQAVEFARAESGGEAEDDGDDYDELSAAERGARGRWPAAGAKDYFGIN
ncbi:hypothetical protein DFH09DRAFT_1200587 [Mycena vulgaris]|nr:hypothetical protein DFH09DRAFT_1200587 [Mycena vulgaris]